MKLLNFATVTVLQLLSNLQSISWHLILILKTNFSALLRRKFPHFGFAKGVELNNNAIMDYIDEEEENHQIEEPILARNHDEVMADYARDQAHIDALQAAIRFVNRPDVPEDPVFLNAIAGAVRPEADLAFLGRRPLRLPLPAAPPAMLIDRFLMDEDLSDVDDDILDYYSSASDSDDTDTDDDEDDDDDADNDNNALNNDNNDEEEEEDGNESENGDNSDTDWGRRITNTLRRTINQHGSKVTQPRPPYAFKPLCLIKCNYKHRKMACDFPLARSGHRVIASESHLYSLGGYNPNSYVNAPRRGQCLLFQELWSYNFATNRWKLLLNAKSASHMPRELASNALAIHNNVLISHGGSGYPFGEVCSNDCYVYTTGEKPLVTRLSVTGDLPMAQYGPGIVLHENYLYTIGGTTGFEYSCDVYRLNLTTKVWENVYICRPEMREDPEGRYRHEVVYDGQHIFVLGGGTSHSVYDLQRIPAFNLKTNSWDYFDTLPDRSVTSSTSNAAQDVGYPKPRKCFSCVQHKTSNGDIEAFVTGGLQGDFATYFADVWKLNLRTKVWTWIRTASLPKPLYFHSAAYSGNGCMYIFGGIEYSEKDMRRRNDLYKMWLTVPKLSEMCWDAITYYNRDLDQFDRSALLKTGIPNRFVERLPMLRPRKRLHSSLE